MLHWMTYIFGHFDNILNYFINFRLSDNASAEAIMSSVRDTMASYKFLFDHPEQQARIIEGSEEGAFSWVTTNYLSGTFGVRSLHSMLILFCRLKFEVQIPNNL